MCTGNVRSPIARSETREYRAHGAPARIRLLNVCFKFGEATRLSRRTASAQESDAVINVEIDCASLARWLAPVEFSYVKARDGIDKKKRKKGKEGREKEKRMKRAVPTIDR